MQLAGGKLPHRLLHSRGADDRVRWKGNLNLDLKRDIEYGLHNGLHVKPTRVSYELLSTGLTNWKINTPAFLYFEGRTRPEIKQRHLKTRDGARRIAVNIAKLLELLTAPGRPL